MCKLNASITFLLLSFVAMQSLCTAVELPQTGQSACYDSSGSEVSCIATGQDGEHQAGRDWPSPRFTDHGNDTITDNLTRLMWSASAASPGVFAYNCSPAVQETLTWSQALALAP
jgi:hypothetical protein